jgi:phage N-6-adenine-methyltransferase
VTIVGRTSLNHPLYGRGAVDAVDDRMTPPEVFGPLNDRFGFTLDACASDRNARCARYFTAADDGLQQSWAGETVWCNPPFSRLQPWVAKAWREHPTTRGIVLLLPANRTEQTFWQDLIEPYRDRPGSPVTTEFLPGRPRFLTPEQAAADMAGRGTRPPFGCVVVIWHAPPLLPEQLAFEGPA